VSFHNKIHFVNFSRKLTVTSVFFLVPLHFLSIGFNGWQIGIVMSLFAFAPLLISFPTGWTNDRFSIAGVVHAGLFAESLLFLLIAWAPSFFLMAALFFLLGIAHNALDISVNSMYYKDETEMDQNKKFGTYTFWVGLGPAIGVFGGGFLNQFGNFRALLVVFSAFTLVVLLGVRHFDHERFCLVPFKEYRNNLFQKKTLLFVVFIFVLALHWGVEGTVYSPFLEKFFGLNKLQISFYISIPLAALALTAFSVGFLKYNPRLNRRLLLLSMAFSGAGLILMVNRNVYVSFLFRILHEIGDGGLGVLIVLSISRLFERRNIGGSAGLLIAIQIMGQMVGALVYAPLGYRYGLQYPFFISGALLLVDAAYGFFIFRHVDYYGHLRRLGQGS
jgi:DHA1 family quinolone resistance protein-like MFS transporter